MAFFCPTMAAWSQSADPAKKIGSILTTLTSVSEFLVQVTLARVEALQSALLLGTVEASLIQSEIMSATSELSTVLASVSAEINNTASALGGMSAPLPAALSCPVFEGGGTRLGEDSCAWARATGQRTTEFGVTTEGAGFSLGGQREIAPSWFLGGSLGVGSTWMQQGGTASLGQNFSASVALKHVEGPWLLAGAVMATTSAIHMSRPAPGAGTMQSDLNVFRGGLRLRAAYDAAFDGWYIRPRIDLDAYRASTGGLQEYGPSSTGMVVYGVTKTSFAIAPAIELGGRVPMGALLGRETILRAYLVGGAAILPDNNLTMTFSFTGPLAVAGGASAVFASPPVLGMVEAGLQLYQEKGLEMRMEYKLAAGQSFLSQGLGLRGAWHF